MKSEALNDKNYFNLVLLWERVGLTTKLMSSRMKVIVLGVVFIIMGVTGRGKAANILCVAPSPAISHFQMLEPLMLSLVERGHNVTMMSCYPRQEKLPNYTDISLQEEFPLYELDFQKWSLWDDMFELFDYGAEHCRKFATSDIIQRFLAADNKFDLIILEAFHTECLLALPEKFKAPYIVFSAMALPIWQGDWIYNPTEPAYIPDNLCRLGGKMSFYEKLQNIWCHVFFRGLYWWQCKDRSVDVVREHLGVDMDSFEGLRKNVSLVLVNSFHGVTGIRPNFPNVVEVGGIHLKPPKPLPQDIEKFLKESQDGVIVISMGSIVKAHTLNPTATAGFLSAISKLKQRVLWRRKGELPNKPDNLMTVSWLPQSDVLGHPKVKLFISHGGIHGLYEAIDKEVPIVGIPLFGDQKANLKALELRGAAVVIELGDLNEKTLSSAISRVLSDDSFRKNMEELSRIFRDQPQSPLERAIFWTEYVLRHKGAPHFQNGATQLSWLQYALIDVLLFCVSSLILLIVVFYYSLKLLRFI